MSWFDEQIRQRKLSDDEVFSESFFNVAGAVLGRKMASALHNESQRTRDALAAILKYYNVKMIEIPETIKDYNEQIEYLIRPYGMMRRNVKLSRGWRKDAVGAMLGTLVSDGSVVALIPGRFGGYYYDDPNTGKRVKITHRTEKLIDDEAVAFYMPYPLRQIKIRDLALFIKNTISHADIAYIIAAYAIVALIGLINPLITKSIYSDVIPGGSTSLFVGIAVFLVCYTIGTAVIEAAKSLVMSRIEIKVDTTIEAATMMRIMSLQPSFFKEYSAGELSSYAEHFKSLSKVIISTILNSGLTSVFSLVYIFQIFTFAPALVIPSIIVTLTTILVSLYITFKQMKITKEVMQLEAKDLGTSYALISGVQKIKLAGAEKRAFARWANEYAEEAELEYNPPIMLKLSGVISAAISMVGTIVIYYIAVKSKITVADYNAFNVAYGYISAAFSGLAGIAATIATIKPTLDMAKPIMDAEPEIAEGKKMVTSLSGGIELNNVTFKYNENMPNVVDNLSLKIKSGQYVAIVGRTGCGKSTLVRLLLGFEKPQKGAIYYDGRDINGLDLKSLRRKIGTVMQNGKLFQGDIYSNITISAPWLTVDEAWEAAEMAGMADDIRDMPMGMNTLISEGEGGVSGGQRQRLMIARAVAPKPKILIFDEATSALDNITQKKVSEALDQLKCTRIVIAHRLSTIKQCDRIIVLDNGHIVEDGTYNQLIEKNGFFAELVERQRLDNE